MHAAPSRAPCAAWDSFVLHGSSPRLLSLDTGVLLRGLRLPHTGVRGLLHRKRDQHCGLTPQFFWAVFAPFSRGGAGGATYEKHWHFLARPCGRFRVFGARGKGGAKAGGPGAAAAARGGLARPGQCGSAHWRVEVATPLLAMAPSGGGMAGGLRAQMRVQSKMMEFQGGERQLKVSSRQWCASWTNGTSSRC